MNGSDDLLDTTDGDATGFNELTQLENNFYRQGFEAGFEHGKLHGVFEGRAFGQDNGYDVWEELGYYRGQAKFWEAIARNDASKQRARQHIAHLTTLIDQYPTTSDTDAKIEDVEALMKAIRSKYRVMCSSLLIRPRIQTAALSI